MRASLVSLCMTVLALATDASGQIPNYVNLGEYSASPLEIVVTDHKSEKPLKGVVGLIGWQIETYSLIVSESPYRYIEISEGVSGDDGVIRFPGWGPKRIPVGSRFTKSGPRVLLFKADYLPHSVYNVPSAKVPSKGALDLVESKRRVRLKANEEPLEKYENVVASHTNLLKQFSSVKADVCNIEKFPRMLAEIIKVESRARKEGIHTLNRGATSIVNNDAGFRARGCASIKELVEATRQ